jgi:hypothetical protein
MVICGMIKIVEMILIAYYVNGVIVMNVYMYHWWIIHRVELW